MIKLKINKNFIKWSRIKIEIKIIRIEIEIPKKEANL